ncbi:MAG: Energy-dependent translational throttle protein EttA, partial [uncultured Frankineae bacterium]
AAERQGPPDQEQEPPRALRGDGRRGREEPQARLRGDPDPRRAAAGQRRHRGGLAAQGVRRPGAHRRAQLRHAARRHRRDHRPERRRQDHVVQDHRRAGAAGRRLGARRRHRQDLLRRPEPLQHRPGEDRLAGRLRRSGLHQRRRPGDAQPRLHRRLRLQGSRPAEEGRRAVGRGAQPAEPGADPEGGRQRPAARRADERPGHRDPRLARERPARVPRLRRGDQPRPLVPRPRRHAHPGVGGHRRGPELVVLVRGQLRVLREEQGRAARGRRGPPPPRHLPQADARL